MNLKSCFVGWSLFHISMKARGGWLLVCSSHSHSCSSLSLSLVEYEPRPANWISSKFFYWEEIGFSPLYHLSYFSQYVYMYFRSFCLNYSFLDHIMTISPDSTFLDDNMLSMKERKLFCINFEIVFIYQHVACVLIKEYK